MPYLVFIVCVFCVLVASRYNDRLNPQTLFCGFIGFIFIFSTINYLHLTSFLVCMISILGVISYSFGVRVASTYIGSYTNSNIGYKLNQKFVFYLVLALTIWSIYKAFTTVVPLLLGGFSLDYIRMVYFGTEVDGVSKSSLDGIVEVFVNQPFLYVMMPMTAYELTLPKEHRQMTSMTVLLVIVWSVTSCLISGGRMLLYNFFVVIVIAFMFSKKVNITVRIKKNKSFIKKMIIIAVIVMFVYLMFLFSQMRNDDHSFDFMSSVIAYFSGCVPHTSLRLATESVNYTFGMTFLSGFLRPVMLLYKYTIGGGSFPEFYQQTLDIASNLQEAVIINGSEFNAFALPFYFFYYDANIIGVIIESAIYGYFCGRAYFRLKEVPTHINMVKYLIVCIYIFTSMVRFSPYIVSMAYAYIFVKLCYRKVY